MYLKSIEISGFKSFAKKVNIEFKSPVTAIVGPNGSGKSNVAEGFRFVLGEQSMKSMRGKRGEDLLWSGSSETPRANRAGVKAIFDNTKKIFNIDFEEVSIERVVNRDGTSEYYINGSQVRLRDVLELLAQAHIGVSGHHIISQGEADGILSANTKERRSMIEDALGLKVYQYKKQESERKLLKTGENIAQVESLRREIAPHLRFLKKQMEKLEKSVQVKQSLLGLLREYLKREKIYLDKSKRSLEIERDPLIDRLKELDKLAEEAKQILEFSGKVGSKTSELLEIEEKIKSAREQKNTLDRKAGRIEGEILANTRLLEKYQAKLASYAVSVPLEELEKIVNEVSNMTDLQSIKDKLGAFLQNLREGNQTTDIADLENDNKKLREKIRGVEGKLREAGETLLNLQEEYNTMKLSLEKEREGSRVAENELLRISSERNETRLRLDILTTRESKLMNEETDWKRQIEEGGAIFGTEITGFALVEVAVDPSESRAVQDSRRREIEKLKIRYEELGGLGGVEVEKEYKETSERDLFLERELSDLHTSSESLRAMIVELEERLNEEFKLGIDKINKAFQNYFSLMFGGGSAELSINKSSRTRVDDLEEEEEEDRETEEGIDISVSLPKKRVKGLTMLSGGERALTSIALLFAISQVNPPPFIILDETDAALDEANSRKYGEMIESLSKHSQLILITHNRETMSRAGVIYGVTMGAGGYSKLLSIAFDEAVAVAK